MRKEILKRVRELEERIHIVGGVLASCFVLTFFVWRWHAQGAEENPFIEALHWTLLAIDVLILIVFVGILLFRRFGLAKPTRALSRVISNEELSRKVREWLISEVGDPSPKSVRFCSEDEMDALVGLNHEAFKNSVFEVEKEKLIHRNTSWIHRNPRVFLLILDPLNKTRYVGYSAMVPLTKEGLDCYLDGGIRDADVPASFIAPNKASTAGVLIFAIYLKREFSFQRSEASRSYSLYFLASVRYHLAVLFPKPKNPKGQRPYPPIYVQTEYPAMERRLRRYGFAETRKRSADGFELFVLEHPFRHGTEKAEIFTQEQPPTSIE